MKTILSTALIIFLAQIAFGQRYNSTTIFKNKDIQIVLECRDTADMGQPDWLKLRFINHSRHPILILGGHYAINREFALENGEIGLNYGDLGTGHFSELLDNFNDLQQSSNNDKAVVLDPNKELVTWKHLTNYASAIISQKDKIENHKHLFELNLDYKISSQKKEIKQVGEKFSFHYIPDRLLSSIQLVKRLQEVLIQEKYASTPRTYIIHHLMEMPEIAAQIPSIDFVNAILSRQIDRASESTMFLMELKKRNALPDSRLTERYRQDLKGAQSRYWSEQVNYWDDDMLDDLLKSNLGYFGICSVLEINVNSWSNSLEKRDKVYQALTKILAFDLITLPDSSNFAEWSRDIKWMSVSRDKRIIDYLVELLDNETTFSIADWSQYRHMGVIPTDPKPEILKTRICDIAFVSLLRAIGQTDCSKHTNFETNSFWITFKEEFLGEQELFMGFPKFRSCNVDLHLAEKHLKLTPETRTKIKNHVELLEYPKR